jgi:large-conductance mechanosensitive channel
MIKTAWRLFLAQSYALAFSAVLLSQPMGFLAWFGGLPWLYWGTDLLEAMVYQQAPDAGSVWLGLFVVQVVVGFLWLLSWTIFEVMALIYNAAVKRVEQERSASAQTSEPSVEHTKPSSSVQLESINDLVEDPEIQKLMHDLERRLRA